MLPELWRAYCRVLGLPSSLMAAWWSALWRSPRADALYLVRTFTSLSHGWGHRRPVDTAPLFNHQAGPDPMLRLLPALEDAGTLTRSQTEAIRTAILDLAVVVREADWRGIPLSRLRWLTEDEVYLRAGRGAAQEKG